MKPTIVHSLIMGLASWALLLGPAVAQTPTAAELGKALGFTDAEITRIQGGELVSKNLQENSDKELAGVVAVLFKQPVSELVNVAMQGKMLETNNDILDFRVWKADASADEAFAALGLAATETAEAKLFANASAGSKLNLSKGEIASFQGVNADPNAVNIPLRAMLKARYAAYRKSGLAGIAPYARGGRDEANPGKELVLAIKETMTVARRQDFFNALLSYPANPLADVEHRFYWFKQTVENRPTFILAHRAERHTATAALLTEEQFYVGHSYNSNFIAGGCLEVEGGTLVFYVNRTFTDQVAGWGSSLKHSIGRAQMLSQVTESLTSIREKLQK